MMPSLSTAISFLPLTMLSVGAAVVPAERNSASAWLADQFPHTGAPDSLAHRLQRIEAEMVSQGEIAVGQVTCRFLYPEVNGEEAEGQVRFFLPPALRQDPRKRLPLLHCAGYEADLAWAAPWLQEGYVVTTVHGHSLNPIIRGPNLEIALLHAVRRLPFIDDEKVLLWGGSAGGYMALMLAAQTFPLVAVMPEVPPSSLCYNLRYLQQNNAAAHAPDPATGAPVLPVLAAICDGLLQVGPIMGTNFESEAVYAASPVAHLGAITAPVLATFSTADMLVPIHQVCADLVVPFDRSLFPAGFCMRVDEVLRAPGVKTRLFDALPAADRQVFHLGMPPAAKPFEPGKEPPHPTTVVLPFSKAKPWSIVILDEGAPLPFLGHLKYGLRPDYGPFWHWALERGVGPEQLTEARLERLMRRYLGQEVYDVQVCPDGTKPFRARRLDYPAAEKADVLRALRTFASRDDRALKLARCYKKLAPELRVFGAELGHDNPESVRASLARVGSSREK